MVWQERVATVELARVQVGPPPLDERPILGPYEAVARRKVFTFQSLSPTARSGCVVREKIGVSLRLEKRIAQQHGLSKCRSAVGWLTTISASGNSKYGIELILPPCLPALGKVALRKVRWPTG